MHAICVFGSFSGPDPLAKDRRPAANYSKRWPVAVAQPLPRRVPVGSKNWTEAAVVVRLVRVICNLDGLADLLRLGEHPVHRYSLIS